MLENSRALHPPPLAGTITDVAGNAAQLILPQPGSTGSLSANKDIGIDTVAPELFFTFTRADGQNYKIEVKDLMDTTPAISSNVVKVSKNRVNVTLTGTDHAGNTVDFVYEQKDQKEMQFTTSGRTIDYTQKKTSAVTLEPLVLEYSTGTFVRFDKKAKWYSKKKTIVFDERKPGLKVSMKNSKKKNTYKIKNYLTKDESKEIFDTYESLMLSTLDGDVQ